MMSDFSRNLEGHVSEAFESLLAAILKDDRPAARKLLKTRRELSSGVVEESRLYETASSIFDGKCLAEGSVHPARSIVLTAKV